MADNDTTGPHTGNDTADNDTTGTVRPRTRRRAAARKAKLLIFEYSPTKALTGQT